MIAVTEMEAMGVEPAVLSPAVLRSVRMGPVAQSGRTSALRTALRKLAPVETERAEIIDEEPERWDGMS